jgi:hypothetical protein
VVIGKLDDYEQIQFDDGTSGRHAAALRTFADATGRFRFTGVAEGIQSIQARAKGLAPWKAEVSIVAGRTASLDIPLVAGARLEGTVRDDAGTPVAGAEVTVSGGYGFTGFHCSAKKDGTYAFGGLPLGEFEVAVDAGDKGQAKTTLIGISDALVRWDPVLARGLILQARVEAPGRDLKGWWAMVESFADGDAFMQTETSDEEGRMEFSGCPDRLMRLRLHPPEGGNWPALQLDDVRAGGDELVLRPDPANEPSIRIRGRVVDPQGAPLSGANIIPFNDRFSQGAPILHTDAEGRFDFGPYPPGNWFIRVGSSGFADLNIPRHELSVGEVWELGDVILQRGGLVIAHLERGIEGIGGSPSLVLAGESGNYEWLRVEQDEARSALITPGRYRLECSGEGIALSAQTIVVQPDEEARVEVLLRHGIAAVIQVLDAEGQPIEGRVSYQLLAEGNMLQDSSLEHQWSGQLLPGHYRFRASDPAGRHGEIEFEIPDTDAGSTIEHTLRLQ